MYIRQTLAALAVCAVATGSPAIAAAQQAAQQAQPVRDRDRNLDVLQPDFTLSALPTTLRAPKFKSAFRVTHRFGRPLGAGDFGDLASDAFGLDSGAQIGLEYRMGLPHGSQVAVYRTNDRTIQFSGQYSVIGETGAKPLGVAVLASVEGTNNFKDKYTPALGVAVSQKVPKVGAFYLEPIWVNNSNPLPSVVADHNDTFLLGIGTRLRVRRTVYLVVEAAPRLAGYDPGSSHVAFGVEKLAGGHMFQLNFSNSVDTTLGNLARGAASHEDWYMGFNISRKFWR